MMINGIFDSRLTRTAAALGSTVLAAMVVAALIFAAPALGAQESTDSKAFSWSGKMPASSWIRVKNLSGDIEVVASDGNTVEVTAEKRWSRGDPADVRFEILKDGDNVTICALWDNFREAYCDEDSYSHRGNSRNRNDVQVYFKVKLPRGVNVHASTVNGSVDVAGARSHVIAASVNGESVVTASTGPVSASSVNGSVRVEMEALTGNDAMTFSSVNGTVTLTLPASFDADLTMSTVNGRLRSDFPILLEGRIDTQRMRGTIGKGGRKVRLSTVNGNIVLKKS